MENQNVWEIACVNRTRKQLYLDADIDSVWFYLLELSSEITAGGWKGISAVFISCWVRLDQYCILPSCRVCISFKAAVAKWSGLNNRKPLSSRSRKFKMQESVTRVILESYSKGCALIFLLAWRRLTSLCVFHTILCLWIRHQSC